MKEYICGGCTDCCMRFPRTVSDVRLLEVTHPGWFEVTGSCDEGVNGSKGIISLRQMYQSYSRCGL